MNKNNIKQLIQSFKNDTEMTKTFGNNITYREFYSDIKSIGLIIYPMGDIYENCYKKELVQINIIAGNTETTPLELKGIMDSVESFLISRLKSFGDFKTISVEKTLQENVGKNKKERYVFQKRFKFYFY